MANILLLVSVITPIITALVNVVKQAPINKNWIPVVAVVLGLLVGFAATPFTDLDMVTRLWAGGLAGLAATGFYEVTTPRK